MEIFWRGLLVSCVFTVTIHGSEDSIEKRMSSDSDDYREDIATAEDHEHHRIIIVVPKEMPQHVNHIHTYKLAGKGIPLIHSGKVVHDHKHSGKVAHEHGHAGKSSHSHKHVGAYGHQHKHLGYLGHKHFGKFVVKPGGHGHLVLQPQQLLHNHNQHHPQLRTAAHKLHLQHQQHLNRQQQQQQLKHQSGGDYLVQQHGAGGGSSGVLGVAGPGRAPPVSGRINFVPSSRPQGLGSFIPAEIQQFVDGRHGGLQVVHHQQQQQQYVAAGPVAAAEDEDDGDGGGGGGGGGGGAISPPAGFNVIHLRVPDGHGGGPNAYKQVDIDLTNNVAKLQTGGGPQQPVTANFKTVTQYNKVIGHGRAVPVAAEEEFDAQTDDEDVDGGGGGELLLEDVGYRFGEGYRLAMDSGGARDFSAAQEQDEEEVDEFNKEPSIAAEDDFASDGNAYSQAFRVQY